jgi:hypothetical protein
VRRVVYEDDEAPHQIRVFLYNPGALIAVGCTCLKSRHGKDRALAMRLCWDDPNHIVRIWRRHVESAELHKAPGQPMYERNP